MRLFADAIVVEKNYHRYHILNYIISELRGQFSPPLSRFRWLCSDVVSRVVSSCGTLLSSDVFCVLPGLDGRVRVSLSSALWGVSLTVSMSTQDCGVCSNSKYFRGSTCSVIGLCWSLIFLIICRCYILFPRICLSSALSTVFSRVTFLSTIKAYCSKWAQCPEVVITSTVPTSSPSVGIIYILGFPVCCILAHSDDITVICRSAVCTFILAPPFSSHLELFIFCCKVQSFIHWFWFALIHTPPHILIR